MRLRSNVSILALLGFVGLATAIPVLGQDKPESILPPGFGEPDTDTPPRKPDKDSDTPKRPPTDLVPDVALTPPPSSGGSSPRPKSGSSGNGGDVLSLPSDADSADKESDQLVAAPVLMDIPPQARRSTAMIGILGAGDGDMGADAFNGSGGPYLSKLMRHTEAPLVSRWGSILLRRALLSDVRTPVGVNGADWAAERAWLLLRMGEADSARMMVQAVDVDQYTPKMYQVAMQAALANADPAALCAMSDSAEAKSKEPAWLLSRAMCSGLEGESAQASALIDRARDSKRASGIDVLLAEKVVGAGSNTRRAVTIQWDGVKNLTAWRYGLASATGLAVPERLMKTAGSQVRIWQARSPLLLFGQRLPNAEIATAHGVFSSAALVDFYGALMDETDPTEHANTIFSVLRSAYVANTAANRVAAMKILWSSPKIEEERRYARIVLTARAAAQLAPSDDLAADSSALVASMLAAGLDTQAMRWADVVDNSGDAAGWGLLAVGSTRTLPDITAGKIKDAGNTSKDNAAMKSQFLFAGLAGLGRIPAADVESMAEKFEVPIGRNTAWTAALKRAVALRAPATVALLCGVGLQGKNWKDLPPAHLFHIVSALRQVGYEGEARMIAAEAVMRT
jgi:hypothetical protein